MDIYKLYLKGELPLSAFGIEKGEGRSDYFCTPKGARIIGWTGVDGIHYCTIKAFGEKVFAVEPMGDAGRHAFPVAESFEDFLRLLMACGHEAYLEQAHAWSRERYDEFARENPISAKANEQILYLQKKYGLSPMEEPYEYLKNIYESFDFTTVPYKKEYYDIVPKEEPAHKEEWQVYFSLHGRNGGERAGEELPLNVRFSWAGYEWFVPCAYICAKGLVLDVFAEADSDKVYGFLFKHMYAAKNEEQLTDEERSMTERENPLAFDFRSGVLVNGKLLREKQGRGNGWVQGYEMLESDEMRDILAHYELSLDKCFIWRRISFPWATKTKPTVKNITLKLEQRPISVIGDRFFVSEVGQKIKFTHPVTNAEHTLTVLEYTQDTLNFARGTADGYEHPACCTVMSYSVEPKLSNSQFSISDTRRSDVPKKISAAELKDDFASTIAIIGGADGPTAVFVSAPKSTGDVHTACSALTFEVQSRVKWKMTFREKTTEDIEVELK